MTQKQNTLTKTDIVALLACVCCILWGSAIPVIKTGYRLMQVDSADTASQIVFAGVRFTLAGILVLIFASIKERKVMIPDREILKYAVPVCLAQTVGQYFFFYIGVAHTSGVKGAIITGLGNFIAILLSCLAFRSERMTGRKIAGCVLGFAGVVVINLMGNSLDMGFKLDILTTIRMLARKKNLAVIMSLHELDLAQKISDTIACVKGDRIDRVGTPEEIFSGNYVQQLYGVKSRQFDPQTGQVFMERPEGIPEVFVIGGGGTGLAVYNRLQRQNIPFAAGILQENDVEYAAASALAACVFSEKAFFPVSEETFLRAKQMLGSCKTCICALTEFGPYNEKNRQLFEYAKKLGKVCAEI